MVRSDKVRNSLETSYLSTYLVAVEKQGNIEVRTVQSGVPLDPNLVVRLIDITAACHNRSAEGRWEETGE